MKYRLLGKTGFNISELSLGTWQVGGRWGTGFNRNLANKILHTAIDEGVNFIDTADVYESGESERAVGAVLRETNERIYVATKCGRQISPHTNEGYSPLVLRTYVEDSLKRLNTDCIDLIQLHCPPTEVYYRPEIFGEFEKLKEEGKILNLGVSVEKIEEGIKALEYDNVTTIQIIYNIFRQRAHERLFQLAAIRNVGIIVRVPLASGLLTGKFNKDTNFDAGDHRYFNRSGEAFDVGETFSGVPFHIGLQAIEELQSAISSDYTLLEVALKWILRKNEVTTVIPGASSHEQVSANIAASEKPELSKRHLYEIERIYDTHVRAYVHQQW